MLFGMKKLFFAAVLACPVMCGQMFAQSLFEKHERFLTEPQVYVCRQATGEVRIDGVLDEPAWRNAPETSPFVDISGEGFPAPQFRTAVKMLRDDDFFTLRRKWKSRI